MAKYTVTGGGFTYEANGRWTPALHGDVIDLTADDRVKDAVKRGILTKGGAKPPAATPPPPPPAPPPPAEQPAPDASIDDQLAWIDDDVDRARLVLEQEQSRDEDDQRSSLIEKLESAIAAADGD